MLGLSLSRRGAGSDWRPSWYGVPSAGDDRAEQGALERSCLALPPAGRREPWAAVPLAVLVQGGRFVSGCHTHT